jgi:ubiquinone/menaquinone biosynthesis C-methylase UbiE
MKNWHTEFPDLDSIDFSSKKNLRRLQKAQFFTRTHKDDLILDLFSGRCDTSYGLKNSRTRIINGDVSFNLLKINDGVNNKIQMNALQLPFKDGQFDAAIIQGGLHHLESFDQATVCLSELKRIIKSNGYVFISEPGDTLLLKLWLFCIKRTNLWKLTPYSRRWHFLYCAEERTHSSYLANVKKLIDYLNNNWVIELHTVGLITEFFTLKKQPHLK